MKVIELKGLTKFYGKTRGIVSLDLSVEEGEFFGFIGPNGAGKSTTIRTMLGLIKACEGSVKIFGKDMDKEKEEILAEVGYLPSETVFYSGMRVGEVIKLSANLRKRNCEEEAGILCERLELDTSRKIDELSFGNRKKVGIVCALQSNPKLCILDEPTGGLDPLMQREFFSILKERHGKGASIFLSSHVLSEVQKNCSRAAIIRQGKIIACDSVEALAKTNAKRVYIQGEVDMGEIKNIRDVQHMEGGISFLYGGDINILIQALAKKKIKDLSLSEPDLDEIFMHYYLDGGEQYDNNET